MEVIEIPFGAKDSEMKGWEYTIPEGFTAEIKDGKVIVKKKESEDERIRKAIIHYILYETKGAISEATEHTWVKWLDKQKEQKPVEINEYEIIKKHITHDSLSSEVNKRLMECGWYVTDDKPAEWSEEEQTVIDCVVEVLEKDGLSSLATSVRHLRPSWKRSEWSEEDEYVINKVIEWAKIVNPTSTIFEKMPKEQFIKRLKSLRSQSHWKPTASQQQAIRTAIAVLTEERSFPKAAAQLESLYVDLQKLL